MVIKDRSLDVSCCTGLIHMANLLNLDQLLVVNLVDKADGESRTVPLPNELLGKDHLSNSEQPSGKSTSSTQFLLPTLVCPLYYLN